MVRLGVFGGSFDPPHIGHLILAEEARVQLGLFRVLWVLTADPPHKRDVELSSLAERLAMVGAAIEGNPAFALSRVDMDRPGPHWAADTVGLLAEANPGVELIYLMGGDSLRDLPTWGRPLEFLSYCSLGVMRRPGQIFDLPALENSLPGISRRVQFLDVPKIDLSSHEIRRRVQAGLPYRYMVSESTRKIIEERRLYRE